MKLRDKRPRGQFTGKERLHRCLTWSFHFVFWVNANAFNCQMGAALIQRSGSEFLSHHVYTAPSVRWLPSSVSVPPSLRHLYPVTQRLKGHVQTYLKRQQRCPAQLAPRALWHLDTEAGDDVSGWSWGVCQHLPHRVPSGSHLSLGEWAPNLEEIENQKGSGQAEDTA